MKNGVVSEGRKRNSKVIRFLCIQKKTAEFVRGSLFRCALLVGTMIYYLASAAAFSCFLPLPIHFYKYECIRIYIHWRTQRLT